jgi:hypothetical protein
LDTLTSTNPPITIENRSLTHDVENPLEKANHNMLQLRENKDPIITDREIINISHNYNAPTTKEIMHIDGVSLPSKKVITIPDYEELSPIELLKYDKRTTLHYLKDLMILDHPLLSLVFRKSLKDPMFMRILQMVFSFSMQFAINAMLYTDDVIDERQSAMAGVTIILI